MKLILLVALLVVIGLGAQRVEAQVYDPYYGYYAPYPDAIPYQVPSQEAYPYYTLEALHYRVYVPYYQSYPIYPYYQPCCIAAPLIVTPAPTVIIPRPIIGGPRVGRRR